MTAQVPPDIAADLRRLLAHSHSPYSGVPVAAVVEDPAGGLHYGVNVENAAYPEGVCAEASAISAMVTQGERAIARVWVASNLDGLIWPCGGCRQKIFELSRAGCTITSVAADGTGETHTIEALLPLGFRLSPRV